ncbi:hypothetical protein Cgig2_034005 [Carnegiea gigantea]|uniref:SBP-type domain-containing protein n=1 Tax=Carnegiea gigantea TaxID=171969 RepID=A0A9Q1JX40_9CARY|nr:hypothetical protein Cgig2_034005 [Carnegiea gigantea]
MPKNNNEDRGSKSIDSQTIYEDRSVLMEQQLHPQDHRPRDGWNPKDWEWDSTRFIARPRPAEPNLLHLGTVSVASSSPISKLGHGDQILGTPITSKGNNSTRDDVVDGNSLRLQLGGVGGDTGKTHSGGGQNSNSNSNSGEGPAASSRPNKKVRSGSPGSGGNYPMCQVDDCKEDLSKSKDYHRRHKVCEFHSKATKALVGNQMQRFCQQCSRFHPLVEFDEGKRSCRRRLAGHNRRRRKTQPEDATSTVLHSVDGNKAVGGNVDIVNLLAVLAGGQGNTQQNAPACPSFPDKNHLIQILSKINSLPVPANLVANPLIASSLAKQFIEQRSPDQRKLDLNATSGSTTDLLAALSTLTASAPNAVELFSQRSNPGVYVDKNKSSSGDKDTGADAVNKAAQDVPSLGGDRSSSTYQSPTDSDCQDQETQLNLQLFNSSPGNGSPPNVTSRNYFSSESSNPTEERTPSASPPVTKSLFPLEKTFAISNLARMSFRGDANMNVEPSQTGTSASKVTLELFNVGDRAANNSMQTSPYPPGYASSGSDHSPSSFTSDPQMDRTGRIMFKLFDKDPSHFPAALRTQIYSWLSNSPSEMESYIRPGCVVLSVYVLMSCAAWVQLEENFLQQVSALVQGSDSEFWRSGRFSVNVGRQLAIHSDGTIRICKPWTTMCSPELFLVTPFAVVGGQETSLTLRGRYLTTPGTNVHCTYMGGYSSKEVLGSSCRGYMYDEIRLNGFKIHAASPSVLGRCFIEVENGVRGNGFPVIVADDQICQELRLLESECIEEGIVYDAIPDDQVQSSVGPRSQEEVLHFLNELGWLFQRRMSSELDFHDYMPHRFQFLLTFSVERDYCTLVKRLLDIFVGRDSGMDGLSMESLDALAKMHLLHRAVKRKSKKMVDLLIHYSVSCKGGTAKKYIFPPNLRGPGGVTPLHLAACTSGCYDIVDVLTDDPMQIGLNCWKSLLDDCRQSPYAYAMMRNNHSLNTIVAEKLEGRINGQVSVSIGSDIMEIELPTELKQVQINKSQKSCSKCAAMTYSTMSRSRSLLHRPFIHSMLAIAAVCVCVCLLFKSIHVSPGHPFKWDDLDFGTI